MNTDAQELIFVDLDGTFLLTDSLWEGLVHLARQKPWSALRAIVLLTTKGKAAGKKYIAEQAPLELESLPVNQDVRLFLEHAHKRGASIVLATAADQSIAEGIRRLYPFFQATLASNGDINLKARVKYEAISTYAQGRPFAYIGNDTSDISIWEKSAHAYTVIDDFGKLPTKDISFTHIFPRPTFFTCWYRLLRIHQWFKNLLIFVPLLLAHQFSDFSLWWKALVAVVCFSLAASSVYILNDMLDVGHDRHHPVKRLRPFASGACSFPLGIAICLLIVVLAYSISYVVFGVGLVAALLGYQALAISYSARLKQLLLLDVFVLALFYSYRLVIGSLATGIILSHWLLGFSTFFFLSLALLKRYAEIVIVDAQTDRRDLSGRDYETDDKHMLSIAGIASSFASSLVLVLYAQSEEMRLLYRHPSFLWGASLILLFWLLRLWMLARRKRVNDDPLTFSLKDPTSYVMIACIILVSILASIS